MYRNMDKIRKKILILIGIEVVLIILLVVTLSCAIFLLW